jgi:hypothetical protein
VRRDLQRRIQRLEQALQLPGANRPWLIMIYGGLPAEGFHATVCGLCLEAESGELPDDFKEGVIETAIETGAPFAVVGGLTRWSDLQ